jgi:hypothetical protein
LRQKDGAAGRVNRQISLAFSVNVMVFVMKNAAGLSTSLMQPKTAPLVDRQ